ncbi:hypothetical protein [Nonomuraea sp. SYSU D8015]|uniref:hypothetical protein n=1 Tax=Nonomuraea sp. SYSU D8015 TaxID=2593644 RepID=UPI0016617AB9|nr:hypothetical protein [Nonomuraea sp. SYSU D8015]
MKPTRILAVAAVFGSMLTAGPAAAMDMDAAPISSTGAAASAFGRTAAVVSGKCDRGSNSASLNAYYYTSGQYDIFNRFNWYLSGPGLRNESNVWFYVKRHMNNLPDIIVDRSTSENNVKPGSGGVSKRVSVKRSWRVWVEFTVIFDRSGPDPSCHGKTRRI